MNIRNQSALFLLAVIAIFAAACAGSSADTTSSDSNADGTAAETVAPDAAAPNSASSDSASSDSGDPNSASSGGETSSTSATNDGEAKSLDEYLGVAAFFVRNGGAGGGGGARLGGADTDQLAEEQRLIQQEIQVCMQAQGFQYSPEENTGGLRQFLASTNQGTSPAEYAETEGFGISTRFDAILEGDVDFSDDADPNEEHVATLSDGEADAWQLALDGAPPVRNAEGQLVDAETGEIVQPGPGRQRGGCTGDAQTKVRGDFSVLGELDDEFDALNERIASDARITAINRAWVDCMRAAGFNYETEDEARAEIQSQVGPLLRSFFGRGDAGGGDGQGGAGQGGAGQGGGGNRLQALSGLELTAEQDAELNKLQDSERAIAIASFGCHGDTSTEIADITARYEAEFVEANRSILESIAG